MTADPNNTTAFLAKLVEIGQRQLDATGEVKDIIQRGIARCESKFDEVADMFLKRGRGSDPRKGDRPEERSAGPDERAAGPDARSDAGP